MIGQEQHAARSTLDLLHHVGILNGQLLELVDAVGQCDMRVQLSDQPDHILARIRAEEEERRKLDTILDIPVTISMEVGRSHISIRNLLQLNQGSVVELDRVAGESLDVLVNGTLIAHGEVVVVNDKFGIRLTDVISQVERIKKLK